MGKVTFNTNLDLDEGLAKPIPISADEAVSFAQQQQANKEAEKEELSTQVFHEDESSDIKIEPLNLESNDYVQPVDLTTDEGQRLKNIQANQVNSLMPEYTHETPKWLVIVMAIIAILIVAFIAIVEIPMIINS